MASDVDQERLVILLGRSLHEFLQVRDGHYQTQPISQAAEQLTIRLVVEEQPCRRVIRDGIDEFQAKRGRFSIIIHGAVWV